MTPNWVSVHLIASLVLYILVVTYLINPLLSWRCKSKLKAMVLNDNTKPLYWKGIFPVMTHAHNLEVLSFLPTFHQGCISMSVLQMVDYSPRKWEKSSRQGQLLFLLQQPMQRTVYPSVNIHKKGVCQQKLITNSFSYSVWKELGQFLTYHFIRRLLARKMFTSEIFCPAGE